MLLQPTLLVAVLYNFADQDYILRVNLTEHQQINIESKISQEVFGEIKNKFKMPRIDASRLAGGKRKVKSFAYTCSRNTLAAINTIFIVSYLKLFFLCVDFFFQRFPI